MTSKLIKDAARIPAPALTPFVAVSALTLAAPGRYADIDLRVSAPATGDNLPVVLLSHGHGASHYLSSNRGVLPLSEFLASHGFVVIQPTHLNSPSLAPDNGEGPLYVRSRPKDMTLILDNLDAIEGMTPGLTGRVNKDNVAVVGYSLGGFTASMLLGMQLTNVDGEDVVDMRDRRIKAGVLIGAPGAGERLNGPVAERYSVLTKNSFAGMDTPALVVAGTKDINPVFSTYADWRSDAYTHSPGSKSLLQVTESEHGYGGIAGYDADETTDEDPDRLEFVLRMITAYLTSTFQPENDIWSQASAIANEQLAHLGHVESKQA